MSQIDRELQKARAARDAAMAGKTGAEAILAGLLASLDYGKADLTKNLPRLQSAVAPDFSIDTRSFLMGILAGAMAQGEIDPIFAMRHPVVGPALISWIIDTAKEVTGD